MNRHKVNSLSRQEMIDLANHRAGDDLFWDWEQGCIFLPVNIAGVVLEQGDVVLYTNAVGRALRVWSPLIPEMQTFILPVTHVLPQSREIEI